MTPRQLVLSAAAKLVATAAIAQTIEVDDLECVPLEPHDGDRNHAVVWARLSPDSAGIEVRLYFRRLHPEVEDFYYTVMQPAGGGEYWGVLPDPEDHETDVKSLDWWTRKEASDDRNPDGDLDVDVIRERAQVGRTETRDWISTFSAGDWDEWITDQKNEPVEFFAAVYDSSGNQLGKSEMGISSVREDCQATLDAKQIGEASNQTIGETAAWQHDLALYHWECDHIVSRIDYADVKQEASVCRACVVACRLCWLNPLTWIDAAIGERAAKKQHFLVEVYFGTDRQRGGSGHYTGTPSRAAIPLQLGTVKVSIPISHKIGELESPTVLGVQLRRPDPDKHILVKSVHRFRSHREFLDAMRDDLAAEGSQNSALVFVHGYGTTFDTAARRTAQMTYDLRFAGVPMFYSWPSGGELGDYETDESNVRQTAPNLEKFLELVAETGVETVHLIAHSMGNRALTDVLARFADSEPQPWNQILLVAPDIDARTFLEDIMPEIQNAGERITLYASSRDRALNISEGWHGRPRAGDIEGGAVAAGFDTIDASNVDRSLIGHSYHAESPNVLSDIRNLLSFRQPPECRFGLIRQCLPGSTLEECRSENSYWKMTWSSAQPTRSTDAGCDTPAGR